MGKKQSKWCGPTKNKPPIAKQDSFQLSEDAGTTFLNVLANDIDLNGDRLSIISVSGPGVRLVDGRVAFTPPESVQSLQVGETRKFQFSYTISDGKGGTSTATGIVTVKGANDAPIAANDAYSVATGGKLVVGSALGVLKNDTDIDGDCLTALLKSGPKNGTLTLKADGSFVYKPNAGFSGTDSFTYAAKDGRASSTATVTIQVGSGTSNRDPIAVNDTASVSEDAASFVVPVLANDSDPDGDALTVTAVSGANVALVNGQVIFTPPASAQSLKAGQSQNFQFGYTISDGKGGTANATATVTVQGANDAPTSATDSYTTAFNTALVVAAAQGVLSNDGDVDGDALSAALVSGPANGTLALSANGSFTYTPNGGYTGADSFTYRANDGTADGNIATVNLTIGDPPPTILSLVATAPLVDTQSRAFIRAFDGTTPNGAQPLFFNPPGAEINLTVATATETADGYVVFHSTATDLASNGRTESEAAIDAYILNHATGEIRAVDTLADGTPGGGTSYIFGRMADGRFLMWTTTDIVPEDTNGRADNYLIDPASGAVEWLNLGNYRPIGGQTFNPGLNRTDGTGAPLGANGFPVTADHGAFIIEQRFATDAGDTDGAWDGAVYRASDGVTVHLDRTQSGIYGNAASTAIDIFPDGNRALFFSASTNLGLGEVLFGVGFYVKDLTTGALTRVDVDATGSPGAAPGAVSYGTLNPIVLDVVYWNTSTGIPNTFGREAVLLPNNRIMFESGAQLVPGMTNTGFHVYIKDLTTGAIQLVDSAADGTPSANVVYGLSINNQPVTEIASTSAAMIEFREPSNFVSADREPHYIATHAGHEYALFAAWSETLAGGPLANVVSSNLAIAIPYNVYIKDVTAGGVWRIDHPIGAGPNADTTGVTTVRDVGNGLLLYETINAAAAGDTDGKGDAYVFALPEDGEQPRIFALDQRSDGTQGSGNSTARWLTGSSFLVTTDSNLLPGDTDGLRDSYVVTVNAVTGTQSIIALDSTAAGASGAGTTSLAALYAARPEWFLVTTTSALVAGDTDGLADSYLKNIVTGAVLSLDARSDGVQGAGQSFGSFVGSSPLIPAAYATDFFQVSTTSALIANDTDGKTDVYWKNPFTGAVRAFDVAQDGTNGNGSSSAYGFVFGDWFAFESTSTNLVNGLGDGTNSYLYLKNVVTEEVLPGFVTAAGTPIRINGTFGVDADGQTIYTTNDNAGGGDDNGLADPILVDWAQTIDVMRSVLQTSVTLNVTAQNASSSVLAWGDGATDTLTYGPSGTAAASHTYAPGTYAASLVTTGLTGTTTTPITALIGGPGRDRLVDTAGITVMAGGVGEDTFVFAPAHGKDVIAGFGSGDVLELSGFGSALDSAAEILASTIDTSAGALITTGIDSSILLSNVTKASLYSFDFHFV